LPAAPRTAVRRCAKPTLAAALALATCSLWTAVAGATITVTNESDSGPGSLREAISDASAGETIAVPAGTYTLTSGELVIAKSLTIAGSGAGSTIVRAGGASRVFNVSGSGNEVTISGLTIREGAVEKLDGTAHGGGVFNEDASLTLENVVVRDNHADANGTSGEFGGIADGGGIYNLGGTVDLRDSTVLANVASAVGGTGKAGGIAFGGGLWSEGAFTIESSTFAENSADAHGGEGAPNEEQSGGIADGGGVYAYVDGGSASAATAITANGNEANASAGIGGKNGGIAEGGGLDISTNSSALAISNATVTANAARAAGAMAGNALGGGIFDEAVSATITLANADLNANTAEGSGGGGDLYAVAGTQAKNTIVSGGIGPPGTENCAGTDESLGHNIDSSNQCGFHAAGDLDDTDPLVGPLQDNGGPVETEALPADSPAVNAATNSGCPKTDARGVARPQGPACDIGAFEFAPPSASSAPATAIATTSVTLNGSASNPDVLGGSFFFEWGTSTSYGLQTPAETLAPVLSGQLFSAALASLTPGVVYHFRAVAVSPEGTAFGADQTFTTEDAVVPTVTPFGSLAAPVLSSVSETARTWREGSALAAITRRKKSNTPPVGTTFSFTVNEAASVTFTFTGPAAGRQVGKSCVAQTKKNRKRKRCTRTVTVGRLAFNAHPGTNRVHFEGLISKHKRLSPGSYKLLVTATASGKRSSTSRLHFTIVG
jgi:hypothetical protein